MVETNPSKQILAGDPKEEHWEEKKLAVLLEAASIAIKRARYVFILINIAAILIFAGEFNATFPWIRNVIERDRTPWHIKSLVLDVWYKELQVVSVPLIGIKFSAFDLTVIGSLAGLLLAIWFYYAVRREHLVVNEIYTIADSSSSKQKRAYLYHGIAHYFVYTTASTKEGAEGLTPQATARAVVQALFFVPAWLPLLILIFDVISLRLPPHATYIPECNTLWCVLEKYNQDGEAILRMVFAFILSLFSLSQCWGAYTRDKATRILVERLQQRVVSDNKP